MAQGSRKTRQLLVLGAAVLAAAVVALVVVGVVLPLRSTEKPPAAAAPEARERAATASEMDAAAARATQALRAHDAGAWAAALPASGRARRSVTALFEHVARLPWTTVRIVAEPVDGHPGRFFLGAVGELAGADPPDRIMARRVYDAVARAGRAALRADVTPRDIRGQQIMAFRAPVVVRRNGLVVIADKAEQAAAEELARAGGPARDRLKLLGLTSRKPVVVYCYASRAEMRRSLGEDPGEERVRFFSHPPIHLEKTPTWTRDVGVLGPALAGKEAWTPQMLAHELTHAYTTSWFVDEKHAPTLLAEGLATAVEGGRSFQPLRDDLAAATSRFPLEKALRARSLWKGNAIGKVRLAYLEGASLVLYVLDHWNLRHLKAFVRAVGDSDLTRKGLDAAARDSLGVRWHALRAGWTSFVQTLP
ncbi:MAG TPA: hypothetical protein VMH50_11090 [Thermoleophilia bacterium]|nr:hypothetical protein [Thermoleophilia bacterium]